MVTHKTYLDNCKLTNVKLHLNSEFFPYDDLNLDFTNAELLLCMICLYVFVHFTIKFQKKVVKCYSGQILLEISFL